MTAVDIAALQAAVGPRITLAGNVSTSGTSPTTGISGFSAAISVYIEAAVKVVFGGRGAPTLTLLVEQSSDGVSWSTAETFTFTSDGKQTATLTSPSDYLRCSWSTLNQSEWYIDHIVAVPPIVNTGSGGSSADKLGLTPTAVKTGPYTAVAGDLVPVDTTSGGVTITLPTAPADGSVVAIKHVIQGSTNTVSLALGGSDVFNKAGGSTTGTLTLVSQGILCQYKATGAIWYVVADDLPLAQLDTRYYLATKTLDQITAAAANVSLNSHRATNALAVDRVVTTVTQSATPAINTDNIGWAAITGLAQAITSMTSSLSGTPSAGQSLIVEITDNGTARGITWGSSFESSTVSLPTTTVISTKLTVGFFWNAATSKWRCVAVA